MADASDRGDLDDLIGRVDPDRWLTTRFIGDAAARADVIALYAYDHELARAARGASHDLIPEIRLTWWREVLDETFAGGRVRRHPTAEALCEAVRRRSLLRAPLEAMIDGRIDALGFAMLDGAAAYRWANAVQGSVAALAASILDPAAPAATAAPAGRAWGLVILKRAGLAAASDIDPLLREALAEARAGAGRLGVAAFPAALPARLARFHLEGRAPSPLRQRLSLVVASVTGRT